MAGLTGLKPSASYKSILRIDDNASGVDGTLEFVTDGEGTSTPLKLSSTDVRFQYSSDSHNISLGKDAGENLESGAESNICIGKDAGEALATGDDNILIGYNAGSHYTGSNLTAIGYESNSNIASGGGGTFVGKYSGRMKQGVNNVAVGYDAMGYADVTGDGGDAGYTDYSPYLGHHNTAIGMDSMFGLYDGNYNACIGTMAGFGVNDGSNNFFAGYKAAFGFTGMSSSVIIGANTALAGADESNAIVIGANAIGKGSNKAVIGDDNITDIYLSEDSGATVHAGSGAFVKSGTAKSNLDILSLTNTVNAADMDGTETSILFNQWYYDGSTPALADAARISVGTSDDWTSTVDSQQTYMTIDLAGSGVLTEVGRFDRNNATGQVGFKSAGGIQATIFARVATDDGTGIGTIPAGISSVIVNADSDANHIIILPAPVLGNIIHIMEAGTTGYELRSSAPASIGINGGTASNGESAIAGAITYIKCVCVSTTNWICSQYDADGDESKVDAAA